MSVYKSIDFVNIFTWTINAQKHIKNKQINDLKVSMKINIDFIDT